MQKKTNKKSIRLRCDTANIMQFTEEVSFSSFNDAWETWDTHFRRVQAPKVKLEQFRNLAAQGNYRQLPLSQFKSGTVKNVAVERLMARTPSDAYPDKPRGVADLRSIQYQMRSKTVSPIVVINVNGDVILLDGMHRLVAASLARKQKIPVLVLRV